MIGTYLKLGMTALGGAGLLTKLIIVLGLAGSLLAAYGVWHHRVYGRTAHGAKRPFGEPRSSIGILLGGRRRRRALGAVLLDDGQPVGLSFRILEMHATHRTAPRCHLIWFSYYIITLNSRI